MWYMMPCGNRMLLNSRYGWPDKDEGIYSSAAICGIQGRKITGIVPSGTIGKPLLSRLGQ